MALMFYIVSIEIINMARDALWLFLPRHVMIRFQKLRQPSIQLHIALTVLLLLGGAGSGLAVTLVPQEQTIANYMTTNPGQGRPYMVLDPIIEKVARARAADMGNRNYFWPINPDGYAANYLLIQAGYQLPAWWGDAPTTNYVESIAAGSASTEVTWQAWMNSPPHKVHILGQNSFFATETHYGVGYYYAPNSTYKYYWVIITAPPEPIEIMSPEAGTAVTTPTVAIVGTTDPTTSPKSVQYRVENLSGIGAYQVASGTANWTGTAALAGGANVIRAQSLNSSGSMIAETTTTVEYIEQGTLNVSVSGSGSLTAGFAGTSTRQVGTTIGIRATPGPGSIFTGWTGSIVSSSTVLIFPMQKEMSLQANFVPSPFPPLAGPYDAMLTTGTGVPAGIVGMTVSAGGLFTGRILEAGHLVAFTGSMSTSGSASVSIPDPGHAPSTLTFQDALDGGSGEITGTFTDGGGTFDFAGSQATYAAGSHAAPEVGRYTLVLAPDPALTGSACPQGNGYAAITIGPAGGAILVGRLADGTPFSTTGRVANDGTLAIYFVPAGELPGSSVTGLLTFESTDVSDVEGMLSWTKVPSRAVFYPAGFSTELPVVGSRYAAPTVGLDAMDIAPGAATAGFEGGGLAAALDVPVTISRTGRAVATGAPAVTLALNPLNGIVSGTLVPAARQRARVICGAVLQKQNAAFGYFSGAGQCGDFSLVPGL